MSASDPRIHFGLGKRDKIESLEITWPSGQVDKINECADRPDHRGQRRHRNCAALISQGAELNESPSAAFSGSSLIVLGSTLLDALTTATVEMETSNSLQTKVSLHKQPSPVAFVDVAHEAGLTVPNVWGGVDHKRYIIEAKGSGLAFFDYDNDGWLDIYLTNGNRLDANWPAGKEPTSHLYKNNRDGTFTDVTEKSRLARTGWQTGVCVGDYDNDGWDDLFCCFWGHNILFHNNGDGTFTDVTQKAGLYAEAHRWGAGCTWLDYNRDGHLDLFVCNYIKLDPAQTPGTGDRADLPVERHAGDVRPAWTSRRH